MYQPDCQGVRTVSMVKTLLFRGGGVGVARGYAKWNRCSAPTVSSVLGSG